MEKLVLPDLKQEQQTLKLSRNSEKRVCTLVNINLLKHIRDVVLNNWKRQNIDWKRGRGDSIVGFGAKESHIRGFFVLVERGGEMQGGSGLQMGQPEVSKTLGQGEQQLALASLNCKSKHHGHFNKEQVRISRSALPQILGRLWSKDRKVMWSSQHGLRKCKSCLTSLIAFCDEVSVPTA